MREIPEIRKNKEIERLLKYYKRSYSLVVKELTRVMSNPNASEIIVQQEQALARQISLILKQNDEIILPEAEKIIRESFTSGQAQAIFSLGDAKTLNEATKGVSFSLLARNSVEAMIEDTFEDVLALTNRTDNKIKKTVRRMSGEVMRINAIQQLGYETTRKEIISGLLKEGFSKEIQKNFVGVTDSAGRRWKVDSYVNMLVKTKMQQSYIEGIRTESLERGTDLALISSHKAKDACLKYEGMVISLSGQTDGFPTYEGLRSTNEIFHPHCKHTLTPLRSLDLLPDAIRQKHEDKMFELYG